MQDLSSRKRQGGSSFDEAFYNKLKELVKEEGVFEDKISEEDFLMKHNALSKNGSVVCEYPKLIRMDKNNNKYTEDLGGSLSIIRIRKEELASNGEFAEIDYFPKFYAYFREVKRKI